MTKQVYVYFYHAFTQFKPGHNTYYAGMAEFDAPLLTQADYENLRRVIVKGTTCVPERLMVASLTLMGVTPSTPRPQLPEEKGQ